MRKLLLFILVLTGCTQSHGGGGDTKFLLPWRDADGNYALQEVTIQTLANPNELRGEAAEIYYQGTLSDQGYSGSIARPHLTLSGDVYIPTDAQSAMAVAVYAQFDRLFQYERQQKTSGQISWPRRVGLDLNMVGPDAAAHNNAHYFTATDVIGLLPYTLAGVPISVNQGIVAHEHFHSHFQRVLNILNLKNVVVSALENLFYPFFYTQAPASGPLLQDTPKQLNDVVMRAWNEGLADLFAGIYTHQADFFSASLPQLAQARALNAESGPMWKGMDLAGFVAQNNLDPDQLLAIAYGQGTVLARLLFKLAHSGIETPDAFEARILSRIFAIPSDVQANYATTVMDFERVIPVLLDGFPLTPVVCGNLVTTVSPAVMTRSFAQCSGQ